MNSFREVTQDQFFAFLKADPRDIMPNHANPYETLWETPQRTVIGKSYPGWKNPGDPKVWKLREDLIR